MSFKFIHAADVHLDAPLRGLPTYDGAPTEQVRAATRTAFENLIEFAIDQQVAFLLIAGDLYDGKLKNAGTGRFAARMFAELEKAGIEVVLIRGNHDAEHKVGFEVQLPPNCHVLSSSEAQTVELLEGRVAVHGQSFKTPSVTADLSKRYPAPLDGKLNIGVLHTNCDSFGEHDPYAPSSSEELAMKGYDYWALGHIHGRQFLNTDPWIAYSGCLQGRHARETGPHGAVLVSVDESLLLEAENVDLDVARWLTIEVDITGLDALGDALQRFVEATESAAQEAEGRTLAIRLRFTGAGPLHRDIARDQVRTLEEVRAAAFRVSGADVLIEKVLIETQMQSALGEREELDDEVLEPLLGAIRGLDGDVLALIGSELEGFEAKLPSDVRNLLRESGLDPLSGPESVTSLASGLDEELLHRIRESMGTDRE